MLEHKDEYFNEFEMADLTYDYDYDPDTEQNPFLHIIFHVVVENQLADKDPIEVFQFYNSMRKKKYPRHDTIHLIGAMRACFAERRVTIHVITILLRPGISCLIILKPEN